MEQSLNVNGFLSDHNSLQCIWTELQKNDSELSEKWRKTTDKIFRRYIGYEDGKYIVVAAQELNSRKYLLARRVSSSLLATLSS